VLWGNARRVQKFITSVSEMRSCTPVSLRRDDDTPSTPPASPFFWEWASHCLSFLPIWAAALSLDLCAGLEITLQHFRSNQHCVLLGTTSKERASTVASCEFKGGRRSLGAPTVAGNNMRVVKPQQQLHMRDATHDILKPTAASIKYFCSFTPYRTHYNASPSCSASLPSPTHPSTCLRNLPSFPSPYTNLRSNCTNPIYKEK